MPSKLSFPIGELMHNSEIKPVREELCSSLKRKQNQAWDSPYCVLFSVLQLQDTLKTGKEVKELVI